MFRNGRFQAASTPRSARCRSDQIQVRSGGLLMIGIGAFCISVERRASSDGWLVSGLSSASSASQRSRTASALPVSALVRSVNWNTSLKMGVGAPSPRLLFYNVVFVSLTPLGDRSLAPFAGGIPRGSGPPERPVRSDDRPSIGERDWILHSPYVGREVDHDMEGGAAPAS